MHACLTCEERGDEKLLKIVIHHHLKALGPKACSVPIKISLFFNICTGLLTLLFSHGSQFRTLRDKIFFHSIDEFHPFISVSKIISAILII
jgi:hypothetical protein